MHPAEIELDQSVSLLVIFVWGKGCMAHVAGRFAGKWWV